MSERIERLFARCREENRAAFIPYICAGDPNFARTLEVGLALEKAGADLLELGVPFSDPLADGLVNQLASQRALDNGATVSGVLKCVREIRSASEIPIVLYTYLNPLLRYGVDQFERDATDAGVDGLLILDLPPEEDRGSRELDGLKPLSLSIHQNGRLRSGKSGSYQTDCADHAGGADSRDRCGGARVYLLCFAGRRNRCA